MSDWYDENDEPLGRWEACDEAEYVRIYGELFASNTASVFASLTEVGRAHGDWSDRTYTDRTIYTEWGRKGDAAPLVRCEDRWDAWGTRTHTHDKYVPLAESEGWSLSQYGGTR